MPTLAPHDESLLLAHAEGASLTAAESARVAALLSGNASLAAAVAGMSRDRAALRSLPMGRAPAGLSAAAVSACFGGGAGTDEAELPAEAMASLAGQERSAAGAMAASRRAMGGAGGSWGSWGSWGAGRRVRISAGAVLRDVLAGAWLPRVAMAAVLALAGLGVAFVVRSSLNQPRGTLSDPRLAGAGASGLGAGASGLGMGVGDVQGGVDAPTPLMSVALAAALTIDPAQPDPLLAGGAVATWPGLGSMPMDRARELARDGRLAIRVTGASARGRAALTGWAATPPRGVSAATVDESSARRLAARMPGAGGRDGLSPGDGPRRGQGDEPIYADANPHRPAPVRVVTPAPGDAGAGAGPATAGPAAIVLSLTDDEAALRTAIDAVRTALARAGLEGERVELVELSGPDSDVGVGAGAVEGSGVVAARDADELLWWGLPPSRWGPRVRVPVVMPLP